MAEKYSGGRKTGRQNNKGTFREFSNRSKTEGRSSGRTKGANPSSAGQSKAASMNSTESMRSRKARSSSSQGSRLRAERIDAAKQRTATKAKTAKVIRKIGGNATTRMTGAAEGSATRAAAKRTTAKLAGKVVGSALSRTGIGTAAALGASVMASKNKARNPKKGSDQDKINRAQKSVRKNPRS